MRLLLVGLALIATPGCISGLSLTEQEEAAAARVYDLPYEPGRPRRVVQAGPGLFSHQGRERHAVDFAMPVGTKVLAARGGRVARVKEDSTQGGRSRAFAPYGNQIVVDHGDGSRAVYLHLRAQGAHVETGETVTCGQWIGDSGNTGWTAMPHLHFHVERQGAGGTWTSVPVAFRDAPLTGVVKFLHAYGAAPDGAKATPTMAPRGPTAPIAPRDIPR